MNTNILIPEESHIKSINFETTISLAKPFLETIFRRGYDRKIGDKFI